MLQKVIEQLLLSMPLGMISLQHVMCVLQLPKEHRRLGPTKIEATMMVNMYVGTTLNEISSEMFCNELWVAYRYKIVKRASALVCQYIVIIFLIILIQNANFFRIYLVDYI